jgi:hypothetical protein
MSPRSSGPRRSESVESYIRQTRAGAALALLALAAAIASEQFAKHLWVRHPLLAGLASSAIVVMLSVAVVNEVLEIRRRRRWRVLAQYVMLELVRDARMVWTAVVELAGLMPAANTPAAIDAAALVVRDAPRLTEAVHGLLIDTDRRRVLHDQVARVVVHNDEVLGRWAAVMLNADAYAEVVDRHVELASSLAWLGSLLHQSSEPSDGEELHWRRARSNPAVQITGDMDDDRLAQRIVAITQLAEQLDRGTLDLAVKTVPVAWWEARLGTTAHADDDVAEANGRGPVGPTRGRV